MLLDAVLQDPAHKYWITIKSWTTLVLIHRMNTVKMVLLFAGLLYCISRTLDHLLIIFINKTCWKYVCTLLPSHPTRPHFPTPPSTLHHFLTLGMDRIPTQFLTYSNWLYNLDSRSHLNSHADAKRWTIKLAWVTIWISLFVSQIHTNRNHAKMFTIERLVNWCSIFGIRVRGYNDGLVIKFS